MKDEAPDADIITGPIELLDRAHRQQRLDDVIEVACRNAPHLA